MFGVASKRLVRAFYSSFLYLCAVAVCTKEEVGRTDSLCIDPVDLNNFFDDEEGKIYGYQGLEVNAWICLE